MSGVFGRPETVIICGLIAFLVTYALVVEVTTFTRDRTFLAATIVALTVTMLAAVLARPAISLWASRLDAPVWHNWLDFDAARGPPLATD